MNDKEKVVKKLEELQKQKQKYLVVDNSGTILLVKYRNRVISALDGVQLKTSDIVTAELTELEIKSFDPRYWLFSEPVEEVEE